MIYEITPVPKPRMTRSDKWKKRPCVMRYRAFADKCKLLGIDLPESGATIIFYLPMPKSWSKKKKAQMIGTPHRSRPDISNLIKALEDALYLDDSIIWNYGSLTKLWGNRGCISINYGITTVRLIKGGV